MPRVVHFEIHADDTNRASAFYEKIFGWKFNKWDGPEEYYLINTGPDTEQGINGGLMKRRDPKGNVYNTINVDSVDDYIKKVEQNGGKVVVPKMAVQGVGYLAYCTDTEENVFGIMNMDSSAK